MQQTGGTMHFLFHPVSLLTRHSKGLKSKKNVPSNIPCNTLKALAVSQQQIYNRSDIGNGEICFLHLPRKRQNLQSAKPLALRLRRHLFLLPHLVPHGEQTFSIITKILSRTRVYLSVLLVSDLNQND